VIVPFIPGTSQLDPIAEEALKDLDYAKGCGAIARTLQSYLVQLPQQAYDALWKAHAIQPVAPDRYGEQFMQLVNPRLYDRRFGLHWDEPQLLAATVW
jgi:CRISPR-associated endonuclease/helicase Cas3